jgi:hypothetical protein
MTKDTIDLQRAIKDAYDNIVEMQNFQRMLRKSSRATAFIEVNDAAREQYDVLVDQLVDATEGKASAANTDPLTYSRLLPCTAGGVLTYNQMSEIIGVSTLYRTL